MPFDSDPIDFPKGLDPSGSQQICDLPHWTRRGTDGFLGPEMARGREGNLITEALPDALILMGDWCGPAQGIDTTSNENTGAYWLGQPMRVILHE